MNKGIKYIKIILLFILLVGVFLISCYYLYTGLNKEDETIYKSDEKATEKASENPIDFLYEKCMKEPYQYELLQSDLEKSMEIKEVSNISIYFEELENNWKYIHNNDVSYYGASLIKLLSTAYLLENKNIDLNKTLTYTSKYNIPFSDKLKNHKYGDKINLKTLISYTLSVSDNGAYEMLFDYIGLNNLVDYAKKLGVNVTINEVEHYGYLTLNDVIILVKKIYSIMYNTEYKQFLQENMNNTYYNSLNFDNVRVYHKYGELNEVYHDIGISFDGNYIIIIMSNRYASSETKQLFQSIHKSLYTLYFQNKIRKETYCRSL